MAEKIVPVGLLSCVPKLPTNWHEFLQRWNEAVKKSDMFAMLGMLHEGMNTPWHYNKYDEPKYKFADIIIFYLQIADGWTDNDFLVAEGDEKHLEYVYTYGVDKYGNEVRKSARDMRQVVAKKAFDILCQKYFHLECDERDLENKQGVQIGYIMDQEDLFRAITSFFRLEERYRSLDLLNLPHRYHREQSHHEKLARAFLLRFIDSIWAWKELEIHPLDKGDECAKREKYNLEMGAKIKETRLWSIEVLCILDEIGKLNSWALSDSHIEKIRQIAMRSKISYPEHHASISRPVETLDEACLVGSKPAIFLRNYLLDRKELDRLDAIFKEEQAKEEAKRQEAERLQAIANALKAKEEAEKVLAELNEKK